MSIDLNRLRETLVRNQEQGTTYPDRQDQKVFVDRDGQIKTGDSVSSGEAKNLSEVPQETFASRDSEDRAYASRYMPPNARELTTDEGVKGFLYEIVCEFGNPYKLFAFFDGSVYQVMLVEPNLEGQIGAHAGHLYSDGTICLARGGGGVNTLKEAFTKSVVWAAGMSVAQQGHDFPFAYNQ